MIDLAMQVAGVLMCGLILWRAEPTLARMDRYTHLSVRLAMWMATVGAVARLVWIVMGGVPDGISVLMLSGLAMLLICERRLRIIVPRFGLKRADRRNRYRQG